MTAPSAWAVLEGGDPVPGDAGAAADLQRRVADTAGRVDDAIRTLEAVGDLDSTVWSGPAATAFRTGVLEELLRRLRDARGAYQGVSDALTTYVAELRDQQREAAEIAERARRIAPAGPVPGTSAYGSLHTTTATTGVPVLPPAALQEAQQDRDALAARARTSARRCADAITRSVRPVKAYEPSRWERIGSRSLDVMDTLNQALDAVNAHLGVLALLTMPIPGVGQAVGAINLAANLTLLTTNAVLMTQGRRKGGDVANSLVDVGLDAVGVGAGVKTAKAVAKSERGAATAARETAGSQRAMADVHDETARRMFGLGSTPATVSGVYNRAQARGLRNDAALQESRARLHDTAASQAARSYLDKLRDAPADYRAVRRTGATQEELVEDWRIYPGQPGQGSRTVEVLFQGGSAVKSGLEPGDPPPQRTPTAPTGWTG